MTLAGRKMGRFGMIVIAAMCLGVATGAWASASLATAPDPGYSRNASGETYGSAAKARTPDEEPDLILVVSDQGNEGYVRKVDLSPSAFANPQQAVEWQIRVGSKPRTLTVFASDGKTHVGTFTITPTTGSEQAPPRQ